MGVRRAPSSGDSALACGVVAEQRKPPRGPAHFAHKIAWQDEGTTHYTSERTMTKAQEERQALDQLAAGARRAYRTVEDMVHHVVREAITSGIFRPGRRLPQDEIASATGVSRIPVRAALRRLEAEGFVVFEPHKGASVRILEPSELAEIYDLRILLETRALQGAAERITETDLDELAQLADRLQRTEDSLEWVEVRQEFYRYLYDIAQMPRSRELIMKLREDVGRYWLMRRVVEDHGHEHDVIVAALRSGDSTAAENWLRSHLSKVSTELQRLLLQDSVEPE